MSLCGIFRKLPKMDVEASIFWAAFGGGAAAGVVIGVIEFLRWLLSRPLLKVEVEIGNIVGTFPDLYLRTGPLEQATHLFLRARNPHLVPVTVSSFGLYYKWPKGEKLVVLPQAGYQFPHEVTGGKELTQWTDIEGCFSSLRQAGRRPSDLEWVWFKASSGKVFRGKIDPKVIIALEKAFQATEGMK